MVKFKITPLEVLEILRAANPKRRFAMDDREQDIWQYLSETDEWQCIAMTCVDYEAIKGPIPSTSEGTAHLPHRFVGMNKGDPAMTVSAKGEWGWDRVYGPNHTIYEPLEKTP